MAGGLLWARHHGQRAGADSERLCTIVLASERIHGLIPFSPRLNKVGNPSHVILLNLLIHSTMAS